MASNGHSVIAREAWPLLAILVLASLLLKIYVSMPTALFPLLLLLPVAFIFRNPHRVIPSSPLAIVSPASGRVIGIDEQVTDPWVQRQARRYRIRMSPWNVHYLRSPIEGKITEQWCSRSDEPGVRFRYTYWIKTDEGDDIVLSLVLGYLSWWVKLTMQSGERIGQGQPCGFLFLCGLMEVYMPESSSTEIKEGDTLDSGSSILGKLIHNQPVTTSFQ